MEEELIPEVIIEEEDLVFGPDDIVDVEVNQEEGGAVDKGKEEEDNDMVVEDNGVEDGEIIDDELEEGEIIDNAEGLLEEFEQYVGPSLMNEIFDMF